MLKIMASTELHQPGIICYCWNSLIAFIAFNIAWHLMSQLMPPCILEVEEKKNIYLHIAGNGS